MSEYNFMFLSFVHISILLYCIIHTAFDSMWPPIAGSQEGSEGHGRFPSDGQNCWLRRLHRAHAGPGKRSCQQRTRSTFPVSEHGLPWPFHATVQTCPELYLLPVTVIFNQQIHNCSLPHNTSPIRMPISFCQIDHVVEAHPEHTLDNVSVWYKRMLRFHRFWSIDDKLVHTKFSALNAVLMGNDETLQPNVKAGNGVENTF